MSMAFVLLHSIETSSRVSGTSLWNYLQPDSSEFICFRFAVGSLASAATRNFNFNRPPATFPDAAAKVVQAFGTFQIVVARQQFTPKPAVETHWKS